MIKKKLDGKLLRVNLFGTACDTVFDVQSYHNGRPALQLIDAADGGPFGVLTCNLPDIPLEDGEVIIKNWSENEDIAKAALASGYFKDTGKRVATGFVEAQIWRVL
jgi:hypothetical protein